MFHTPRIIVETSKLVKFPISRPPVLAAGHNHQQGLKSEVGAQGADYFVPVNQHKKSFRGEKM